MISDDEHDTIDPETVENVLDEIEVDDVPLADLSEEE